MVAYFGSIPAAIGHIHRVIAIRRARSKKADCSVALECWRVLRVMELQPAKKGRK